MAPTSTKKRIALAFGALMGWFAVALQLVLSIRNRTGSVPEQLARFFTYFTILTNILVALCFTMQLLAWGRNSFPAGALPGSPQGGSFARPGTQAAIAAYITVVGITYNVILRALWAPEGWQFVVNELLHSVIPVYFIVYWLIFAPKTGLQWKNILPWLVYPLAYLLLIMIRGSFSGWYPYPFVDVSSLGYEKVLINSAGMLVFFLLVSVIFIAVGRAMNQNKPIF
jgi:hypothetical protein